VVLSDRSIREELDAGRLVIKPRDDGSIQPASVDLRLGRDILVFKAPLDSPDLTIIDVKQENRDLTTLVRIGKTTPFTLGPGEFVLGVTLEEIHIPDDIVGRLDGKSSLGRLGLVVHSTAGFVDPGWRGCLTLELSNLASRPISLYYAMKVSQISFIRLTTPAERPYGSMALGSKYQGQKGPVASRYFLNFPDGPSSPARKSREYRSSTLQEWLEQSEFQGNVVRFAAALEVRRKTVEEWVYGRHEPSRRNWRRLYEITGLSQFGGTQMDLPASES
jgi:dCTP deaminase